MNILVLAAGYGYRMDDLTKNIPANKYDEDNLSNDSSTLGDGSFHTSQSLVGKDLARKVLVRKGLARKRLTKEFGVVCVANFLRSGYWGAFCRSHPMNLMPTFIPPTL